MNMRFQNPAQYFLGDIANHLKSNALRGRLPVPQSAAWGEHSPLTGCSPVFLSEQYDHSHFPHLSISDRQRSSACVPALSWTVNHEGRPKCWTSHPERKCAI